MNTIIKIIKSNNLYMILCIYVGILVLCGFSIYCENRIITRQVMSIEPNYNSIDFNFKSKLNNFEVLTPISGEENVILVVDQNNKWTLQLFYFESFDKNENLFQNNQSLNNILNQYGTSGLEISYINGQEIFYALIKRNKQEVILGYMPMSDFNYLGFSIIDHSTVVEYQILEYLVEIKDNLNVNDISTFNQNNFDFLNSIINN